MSYVRPSRVNTLSGRFVGRSVACLTARFRLADLLARYLLPHATLVGWLRGHSVCYRLQSHTHTQIYFYFIVTFPAPAGWHGRGRVRGVSGGRYFVFNCMHVWRLLILRLTSTEVAVIYHKHHINIAVIFIMHTTVTHVISTRHGMRYRYILSYVVALTRPMPSQIPNAEALYRFLK